MTERSLPHKTVGVRENGAEYYERPGVYILPVKDGKLGLVRTPKAYCLIGGGKEKGETDFECMEREVREETGYAVKPGELFATAEQYKPDQPAIGYFHPFQYYYTAELLEKVCEPAEKDHLLEWVELEKTDGLMWLEMQQFAVDRFRMLPKSECGHPASENSYMSK